MKMQWLCESFHVIEPRILKASGGKVLTREFLHDFCLRGAKIRKLTPVDLLPYVALSGSMSSTKHELPMGRGRNRPAPTRFVGYAYLLEQEADQLEATDPAGARALRARASKLFIRGRDYALRSTTPS
jgi:hypothetical protein